MWPSLLQEFVREHIMGNILRDEESVRLILLYNSKDPLPIRSITRSPKQVGMWQMQTWDENEVSHWDNQYDNLRDALVDQLKRGFKVQKVVK